MLGKKANMMKITNWSSAIFINAITAHLVTRTTIKSISRQQSNAVDIYLKKFIKLGCE
jgi:predicted peroxiredoxin